MRTSVPPVFPRELLGTIEQRPPERKMCAMDDEAA
jgi:hypothetical protein